jgi:nitrite reductase/ring-hydroxylating ferredoxin subunit
LSGAKRRTVLCPLAEIPDGRSKGFSLGEGATQRELFVVRTNGRVYAYENSCPHTGAPLDWTPDQFLTVDCDFIQCATHGALFRIETGECLDGPCLGEWLRAVRVVIEDGVVVLED